MNEFEDARTFYLKALNLDKENQETNFNIAILNYKQKKYFESNWKALGIVGGICGTFIILT